MLNFLLSILNRLPSNPLSRTQQKHYILCLSLFLLLSIRSKDVDCLWKAVRFNFHRFFSLFLSISMNVIVRMLSKWYMVILVLQIPFFFCHQIHSDRLPVVPVSDSFIRKIHKNGISIDWKRWASKHAYHGSIQISNLILSRWISLLVNNLFFFLSLLCRYFSKMSVIRSMEKKKLDKHVCK